MQVLNELCVVTVRRDTSLRLLNGHERLSALLLRHRCPAEKERPLLQKFLSSKECDRLQDHISGESVGRAGVGLCSRYKTLITAQLCCCAVEAMRNPTYSVGIMVDGSYVFQEAARSGHERLIAWLLRIDALLKRRGLSFRSFGLRRSVIGSRITSLVR